MTNNKELLKAKTWEALQGMEIDKNDSRNVLRWEKLAKLYLQLTLSIQREREAVEPEEIALTLD